ncbi:MAG: hypothetical protein ACXWWQ_05195 [Candidatus Limnocylindria bacterium]
MLIMLLAGCAELTVFGEGPQQWEGPAPLGDTQCLAESYDFVGEATLAGLGLQGAVPAELPEPNRAAMIWVTHDPVAQDLGAPGGALEMSRVLCFEFADGSGGSGWPVDPGWQPPGQAGPAAPEGVSVPPSLILVALGVLLAIAVSVVAFRRRD